MKNIDFTQPGGFPLTQDQLGYMQAAWQEIVDQLVNLGVNNSAPTILGGMVSSAAGATTTVSAGWFVYNGQAVRFPAQAYTTAITSGNAAYVVITPTATPLTFNNGSTPDVIEDSTGVLTILADTTPVDATHFLLSSLVSFGVGLAMNNRDGAWGALVVSTPSADGGVVGTINYMRDYASNSIHLKTLLATGNANNFAASPTYSVQLMGYIPGNFSTVLPSANFIATVAPGPSRILDDTGNSFIDTLNCYLGNDGGIYIQWIKPQAATHYNATFNVIIPLG